jgi:hypothetical protein
MQAAMAAGAYRVLWPLQMVGEDGEGVDPFLIKFFRISLNIGNFSKIGLLSSPRSPAQAH